MTMDNTNDSQPPQSAALSGSAQFAALCETLIEEGEHWLSPEIGRTRPTDWMARIFNRPEGEQNHLRKKLATGQAATMDEACAQCVENYYERQRIEARKAELLQDPNVREALKLFGQNSVLSNAPEQNQTSQ